MAITDQSATQRRVTFDIITRYGSIAVAIIHGIILDSGVNRKSDPASPIGIYGILRFKVAGKYAISTVSHNTTWRFKTPSKLPKFSARRGPRTRFRSSYCTSQIAYITTPTRNIEVHCIKSCLNLSSAARAP